MDRQRGPPVSKQERSDNISCRNIREERLKERQDDEPEKEKGKETDFCSHGVTNECINNAVSSEYDGI